MKFLTLLCVVVLAACVRHEFSAELREPGYVEQVTYVPGAVASGVGISPGTGNVSIHSTTVPERYAIVFSCMHGKFVLTPTGENAKRLFPKLRAGDSVTLVYREEYRVTNKRRELVKLDFVDALVRRNP